MSDKRHFRDCLADLAGALPIVALVLVAALLVSSDRSEASGRGKPYSSPRVAAPHCPIVCGTETNCYPGECYLIGEDLQCGPDDCVTRKACRPNYG